MELEEKRVLCKVCCTQYARYICPRCNLAYCCLVCYKQHSTACTEAFYRDQATHELHSTRADAKTKRELLAMLQRVQQQQTEDDAHQQELLNSLQNMHSNHERRYSPAGTAQLAPRNEDEPYLSEDSISDTQSDGLSDSELDSNPDVDDTSETNQVDSGTAASQSHSVGADYQDRSATQLSRRTMKRLLKKLQSTSLETLTIDESDLTQEELTAFRRALAAGQLNHLLSVWEPWWLTPEARDVTLSSTGQTIIQELQPHKPTVAQPYSNGVQHASSEPNDQVISNKNADLMTKARNLPAGPSKPLQRLSTLTKSKPSPLLKWQLLDMLYVYCYIQRRFNGEAATDENVQEAAQLILHISTALSTVPSSSQQNMGTSSSGDVKTSASVQQTGASQQTTEINNEGKLDQTSSYEPTTADARDRGTSNATRGQDRKQAELIPSTASDALMRCLQAVCRPPVGDMSCRAMSVGILGDVFAVLDCGVPATILALSDLQHIVTEAMGLLTQNKNLTGKGDGPVKRCSQSRKQLFAAANKLWFFMCWLNDMRDTMCVEHELAPAVQSIWQDQMATMQSRTAYR